MHAHAPTHPHTCAHASSSAHPGASGRTHTHARERARTGTCTRTHARTHMHAHSHAHAPAVAVVDVTVWNASCRLSDSSSAASLQAPRAHTRTNAHARAKRAGTRSMHTQHAYARTRNACLAVRIAQTKLHIRAGHGAGGYPAHKPGATPHRWGWATAGRGGPRRRRWARRWWLRAPQTPRTPPCTAPAARTQAHKAHLCRTHSRSRANS
jgi:hypothetical protein